MINNTTLEDLHSLIEQEQKLINNDSTFSKENMIFICAKFIYINTHEYIDKIVCENINLEINNDYGSLISKENLLQIIQTKKSQNNNKYNFIDGWVCNFNISPKDIYEYSISDNYNNQLFIKSFNGLSDILIPPSVFIFHDINTIFFIFKEIPPIKSILKNNDCKKKTKKVRIMHCNNRYTKRTYE